MGTSPQDYMSKNKCEAANENDGRETRWIRVNVGKKKFGRTVEQEGMIVH